MESELETELEKVMNETLRPPLPQPRQPAKTQASLMEQFDTMEKVKAELVQRVKTGKVSLENEYRQRLYEIEYQHDKEMLQAQLDLKAKRDAAVRALVEETKERMKELETILGRLDV